jgi:hypothetical protein
MADPVIDKSCTARRAVGPPRTVAADVLNAPRRKRIMPALCALCEAPQRTMPAPAAMFASGRCERREDLEHRVVVGDLPLLRADGIEAHDSPGVDNEHRRALAEAERAAHDVVRVERRMVGVGDDRERRRMLLREPFDRGRRFGRDRDHRRAGGGELLVVVTQLREVPAAERSGEAPQEHDDDRAVREEIVERHDGAVSLRERELRCGGAHRRTIAVHCHEGKCTDRPEGSGRSQRR